MSLNFIVKIAVYMYKTNTTRSVSANSWIDFIAIYHKFL